MQGKAVRRNQSGEVVGNLSNLDVLRHWRIATCCTELTIRRLKWMQQMALHPQQHHLVLCAIFGTTKGELQHGFSHGVIDDVIQDHASPWALQARKDLLCLRGVDEGNDLLEEVGEQLFRLLRDPEIKGRFIELDVTQLRAAEFSVAIPPPGDDQTNGPTDNPDADDMLKYKCATCSVAFSSSQAMLLHMRRAHNVRKLSYHACITNQCFLCGDIFCTRVAASRHVQRSLVKGKCNACRIYNITPLQVPKHTNCPIPGCNYIADALPNLQIHLKVSHFPWVKDRPPLRQVNNSRRRQHGTVRRKQGARNASLHGKTVGIVRRRRCRRKCQANSHIGSRGAEGTGADLQDHEAESTEEKRRLGRLGRGGLLQDTFASNQPGARIVPVQPGNRSCVSVLDDPDAEDPFEVELMPSQPSVVQHCKNTPAKLHSNTSHSRVFANNRLVMSKIPHRYYDKSSGSCSDGPGSGAGPSSGSGQGSSSNSGEPICVDIQGVTAMPGTKASNFKAWALSSKIVQKLGIPKHKIDSTVSKLAHGVSVVGIGTISEHSHIIVHEHEEPSESTYFEDF